MEHLKFQAYRDQSCMSVDCKWCLRVPFLWKKTIFAPYPCCKSVIIVLCCFRSNSAWCVHKRIVILAHSKWRHVEIGYQQLASPTVVSQVDNLDTRWHTCSNNYIFLRLAFLCAIPKWPFKYCNTFFSLPLGACAIILCFCRVRECDHCRLILWVRPRLSRPHDACVHPSS